MRIGSLADKERVEAIRQQIRHRMLAERFEKNREVAEKHKERGPAFKEAVERLERLLSVHTREQE